MFPPESTAILILRKQSWTNLLRRSSGAKRRIKSNGPYFLAIWQVAHDGERQRGVGKFAPSPQIVPEPIGLGFRGPGDCLIRNLVERKEE